MTAFSRHPARPRCPSSGDVPSRVPRGFLAVVLVLVVSGCATVQPGQDATVVRVEQFLKIAPTIYDQALTWASRNSSSMSPATLKMVNDFRVAFPVAYRTTDAALQVYKANGTGDLMGQIAALRELIVQMNTIVKAFGGPDLLPQEAK